MTPSITACPPYKIFGSVKIPPRYAMLTNGNDSNPKSSRVNPIRLRDSAARLRR
jgi:hypothetical protein